MFTGCKRALLLSAGILLLALGCAGMPRETATPPQTAAPSELPAAEPRSTVPAPEPPEDSGKPAPRTLASLQLTEQARLLIGSNRPDEAIRTLERALNIDPGNGRSYYFLAEAWILKGNSGQATEFNRMARLYLDTDPDWMLKILEQKERIERMGNAR